MYCIVAMGKPSGFEQRVISQGGGEKLLTDDELKFLANYADFGDLLIRLSSNSIYAVIRTTIRNAPVNIYAVYRAAQGIEGRSGSTFYGAAIYFFESILTPRTFVPLLDSIADSVRDNVLGTYEDTYKFTRTISAAINAIKLPTRYIENGGLLGAVPENSALSAPRCKFKAMYLSYSDLTSEIELRNFEFLVGTQTNTLYENVFVVPEGCLGSAKSEAMRLSDKDFGEVCRSEFRRAAEIGNRTKVPIPINTDLPERTPNNLAGWARVISEQPKTLLSADDLSQKNRDDEANLVDENRFSRRDFGMIKKLRNNITVVIITVSLVLLIEVVGGGTWLYFNNDIRSNIKTLSTEQTPTRETSDPTPVPVCKSDFSDWNIEKRRFGVEGAPTMVGDIANILLSTECLKRKEVCTKDYVSSIVKLNPDAMNPPLSSELVNAGSFDSGLTQISGERFLEYWYPEDCKVISVFPLGMDTTMSEWTAGSKAKQIAGSKAKQIAGSKAKQIADSKAKQTADLKTEQKADPKTEQKADPKTEQSVE